MIEKRYLDGGEWQAVSEEDTRRWLGAFYVDIELALEALNTGDVLYTDVAEYRMVNTEGTAY